MMLGLCAAVLADQGAGAGYFPDDDERFVVEVMLDLADERAMTWMTSRMAAGVSCGHTAGTGQVARVLSDSH